MNMIKTGLDWARTQLKTHVATRVKIRRDGIESDPITAVKAGPEQDQVDDAGAFVQRVRQIDWLFVPSEYGIISGEMTEPADDDLIDELDDDGNVIATYVVSSPTGGEPPWRYTDPERSMIRVHVNEE